MSSIVKVCKKHGELVDSDTYLHKTENGNRIKMCSICKRGYRKDWARLNPEKVKQTQEATRQKRLEEKKNGTLSKICKHHGNLPVEKIRIDIRGTKVCCLCDIKNKKAMIARDPEKFRKNVAKWLHGDPERKRKYREKDKPKRRVRQKKLYQKWMQIPEKKKRIQTQAAKSRKKLANELADSYVKSRIKDIRQGGRKNQTRTRLKDIEIPQEVIELKRLQISLNREIRKKRKEKK